MEKHLGQSVLSKLPYGYDSVTRQSLSSTEDDMGIYTLYLIYQILFLVLYCFCCLELQLLLICIGCWM